MTSKKFNPQEHLIKLKGKDYLQVMHRVQWFRTDCPDGSIQTELLEYQTGLAVCKATVMIDGKVISTGLANADSRDGNPIWKGKEIMKAETAAIGRALAHAGFGTQFTEDEEGDFLADSPVDRKPQKQSGQNKGTRIPAETIPAKAENGKKKTKTNEPEEEWSKNRKSDFLMKFTTRFPGAHHLTILPEMGVEKIEDLGTRKQANAKLMEYCYQHSYPVMVNYRRYVSNGKQTFLELTADPVEKNGHDWIRAYGRSTEIKKILDAISPDLYTENGLYEYDGEKHTTEWEPLKIPLIVHYEIKGSKKYPYNDLYAIKLPESEEIF